MLGILVAAISGAIMSVQGVSDQTDEYLAVICICTD